MGARGENWALFGMESGCWAGEVIARASMPGLALNCGIGCGAGVFIIPIAIGVGLSIIPVPK